MEVRDSTTSKYAQPACHAVIVERPEESPSFSNLELESKRAVRQTTVQEGEDKTRCRSPRKVIEIPTSKSM